MFGKIWSIFVKPWAICRVDRTGWRSNYVYARKFFGVLQYVQYYGRDVNDKAKVSSTTFDYDYAHEFHTLNHSRKQTLDELNLPAKARKRILKLTKVETE